jgi:hypothetical protein
MGIRDVSTQKESNRIEAGKINEWDCETLTRELGRKREIRSNWSGTLMEIQARRVPWFLEAQCKTIKEA